MGIRGHRKEPIFMDFPNISGNRKRMDNPLLQGHSWMPYALLGSDLLTKMGAHIHFIHVDQAGCWLHMWSFFLWDNPQTLTIVSGLNKSKSLNYQPIASAFKLVFKFNTKLTSAKWLKVWLLSFYYYEGAHLDLIYYPPMCPGVLERQKAQLVAELLIMIVRDRILKVGVKRTRVLGNSGICSEPFLSLMCG